MDTFYYFISFFYCLDLRLLDFFCNDLVKRRVEDMHHVLWCHLVVSYEAHLVHHQQFYSLYWK